MCLPQHFFLPTHKNIMNIKFIKKYLMWLLCFLCLSVSLNSAIVQGAEHIDSNYTSGPVIIDGIFQAQEWKPIGQRLELQYGWVAFLNDDSTLYLIINLTKDYGNDSPKRAAPWGDFISLSFDVDRNRSITPNVDVAYGLYPGSDRAGIQYYLRPGAWTGLQPTKAQLVAGFSGAYSRSPHRFWEVAIPLSEIKAHSGQIVRIGIRTYSETPRFNDYYPSSLNKDFSELIEVKLATASTSETEPRSNLRREITSEGIVRIYYPDGRIKELFDEGYKIIYPDGTEQIFPFYQVQPLIPPLPPDNSEREWLAGHAQNLLSVMERMVGTPSVSNYKQVESQKISDGNLYEVIGMRLLYINRLLSL